MSSSPKTWLITGSSSGFGLFLARSILAQGDNVVATSRHPSRTPDLVKEIMSTSNGKWLTLDVTSDATTISNVIEEASKVFGTIDVLINNAGYSVFGAAEEIAEDRAKAQFEVNFWGLIRVTQAVLPIMRAQRSGTIVNISSVAGLTAAPSCAIYASSKFAVEAWSESLCQEVAPFGIRVLIVEPGVFRTNFLGSGAKQAQSVSEAYKGNVVDVMLQRFEDMNGRQQGDPVKAAEKIVENVQRGLTKEELGKVEHLRLPLGQDCYDRVAEKLEKLKQNFESSKAEVVNVAINE